eukprot:3202519-Amphidinium_carterae.5
MLRTLTGQSLDHWHRDEAFHSNTPAVQWPMLNLVADQGSDGLSGANFLQHHCQLNVTFTADPCHRSWNDCKQALKRARLWETVLGSCVLLNYPNGPWKEQRFHRRNQEVMTEFLRLADLDDGIVGELSDHILSDHGVSHHRCDDVVLEQLRDHLMQAFRRKPDRVGMCRWFGWASSMEEQLPHWRAQLAGLLYAGLRDGCIRNPRAMASLAGKFQECQSRLVERGERESTCQQDEKVEHSKQQSGLMLVTAASDHAPV